MSFPTKEKPHFIYYLPSDYNTKENNVNDNNQGIFNGCDYSDVSDYYSRSKSAQISRVSILNKLVKSDLGYDDIVSYMRAKVERMFPVNTIVQITAVFLTDEAAEKGRLKEYTYTLVKHTDDLWSTTENRVMHGRNLAEHIKRFQEKPALKIVKAHVVQEGTYDRDTAARLYPLPPNPKNVGSYVEWK